MTTQSDANAGVGAPTNDVRVLFGPGGFVRYHRYGRGEPGKEPIGLTPFAEEIARIGITLARSVPAPSEVTGDLQVDLGDGGRALWVDGGGDISTDDLAWAIVAALEQRPDDVFAAMREVGRRRNAQDLAWFDDIIRTTLGDAGYSTRRIGAFFRRRHGELDGRSIGQVLDIDDQPEIDLDHLASVLAIVASALEEHPEVRTRFWRRLLEGTAGSTPRPAGATS